MDKAPQILQETTRFIQALNTYIILSQSDAAVEKARDLVRQCQTLVSLVKQTEKGVMSMDLDPITMFSD